MSDAHPTHPRRPPFLSVVTPVLDGGDIFQLCLDALGRSSFREFELIVVDDGSTDGSAERARRAGARVLSTTGRVGPAAARNAGARVASGEFLLFLDADCQVHPDTLEQVAAILRGNPQLDALFGCYDEHPADPGLVSQFKNLLHRYVHLQGQGEAVTFWAGCGAVRRSLFLQVDGFDEIRFRRPSIEDIELGYRLTDHGARIRLAGSVQVRHHKRWTLGGLLRTDLFDRGIPWTELLAERRGGARELNLDLAARASVALVGLAIAALAAGVFAPRALWLAAAATLGALLLNWRVYRFFHRLRGPGFALRAMPLHLLYFAYSGVAFLLGTAHSLARRVGASR